MIPEEVAVKFKGASKKDKEKVAEILMTNYKKLVDEFVSKADYACTTGYWEGHIPITKKILTAKEFIAKYGKKKS